MRTLLDTLIVSIGGFFFWSAVIVIYGGILKVFEHIRLTNKSMELMMDYEEKQRRNKMVKRATKKARFSDFVFSRPEFWNRIFKEIGSN